MNRNIKANNMQIRSTPRGYASDKARGSSKPDTFAGGDKRYRDQKVDEQGVERGLRKKAAIER